MYHIYIDAEFDAIRLNYKFQQTVISLGAVILNDEGEALDEFYSLVRPLKFKRLTNIVKKMTHLENEDIKEAPGFEYVLKQFKQWIYTYTTDKESIRVYSFGPDDRRTILQNCKLLFLKDDGIFDCVEDLQKEISAAVKFQNRVISPTLSLDDLKLTYNIQGAVEHNALTDARDLMMLHRAYVLNEPQNEEQITGIVNRKIQKQIEVQERQKKRMIMIMKQRFEKFDTRSVEVIFYPEVLEQLRLWEERDDDFHIVWSKSGVKFEDQEVLYEDLQLTLGVELDQEVPSIHMVFAYDHVCMTKRYILNYRNATMIENIFKRLQS